MNKNPKGREGHSRQRRAAQQQAAPAWLTSDQKQDMRRLKRKAQAEGKTLDHIIPLQGRLVSGLNVPWNLRIIPMLDNMKKGNRMAPGIS